MEDDITKELQKTAEKAAISSAAGPSMNEKKQANTQKAKQEGDAKITALTTNLASISEQMGNSVKGKFGKKIKENFKKQSENLEKFKN